MTVLLLRARNASSWTGPTGNNTYLITGAVPTLVDAGVGDAGHVDDIAATLEGAPLAQVLITHGHVDHVSGLPALRARWPLLLVVGQTPAGQGFRSDIPAGDGRLSIIPTPGHAPDHLAFFDAASGDLFCGDLLRADGSIVIPASKGGDLRQYLQSLREVRALRPMRLLPGHGPIIDEPDVVIDQYLRHREARDAQILAALEAGARTPAEIAARVYGRLPTALQSAAEDTVQAHLRARQLL